jgi:hypothetical protein
MTRAERDAELLVLLREAREICDLLHGFEYGTDRGHATADLFRAQNVALASDKADRLRPRINALLGSPEAT